MAMARRLGQMIFPPNRGKGVKPAAEAHRAAAEALTRAIEARESPIAVIEDVVEIADAPARGPNPSGNRRI